jgi:hypothetical protein
MQPISSSAPTFVSSAMPNNFGPNVICDAGSAAFSAAKPSTRPAAENDDPY